MNVSLSHEYSIKERADFGAFDQSDIDLVISLFKKGYTEEKLQHKTCNKYTDELEFIKMKFGVNTFEEIIRKVLLSGIVSSEKIKTEIRRDVMKKAQRDIIEDLKRKRLLVKLAVNMPQSLKFFYDNLYVHYYSHQKTKIPKTIKAILKNEEVQAYFTLFNKYFDFQKDSEQIYVIQFYYDNFQGYKCDDIVWFLKKRSRVPLLSVMYAVWEYLQEKTPFYFCDYFSKYERKVINYLLTKGDIDEVDLLFSPLRDGFGTKIYHHNIKTITNSTTLNEALLKILIAHYTKQETFQFHKKYAQDKCVSILETGRWKTIERVDREYSNIITKNIILNEYRTAKTQKQKLDYLLSVKKSYKKQIDEHFWEILAGIRTETHQEKIDKLYLTQAAINEIFSSMKLFIGS